MGAGGRRSQHHSAGTTSNDGKLARRDPLTCK
jgi:hypothetical protein